MPAQKMLRAAGTVLRERRNYMLHIHFGAGRLGLGLVAPFFQTPASELYLLNRRVSATKETGSTALTPERRNALLRDHPHRHYLIEELGRGEAGRRTVRYDGFFTYDDDEEAGRIAACIIGRSRQKHDGVVVTASVLKAENYRAVLQALNTLADMRNDGLIGPLFLAACENTVDAAEVLAHPALSATLRAAVHRHVACLGALVDRMCVELDEERQEGIPTVLVRVEAYGSLKLEAPAGEGELAQMLEGSRIEFSRHVAVEKQIKNWLLNGSHWLIALAAYEESQANPDLRLNAFLAEKPERARFAASVMREMRTGVAALLRSQPRYADFVREVDMDDYLERAAEAILQRFLTNDDSIARILARFQSPSPESLATIQDFSKRFSDRVAEPIAAYQADMGTPPAAAMHGMQSLVRLISSGSFIDAPHG